jgi:hypothetical protein
MRIWGFAEGKNDGVDEGRARRKAGLAVTAGIAVLAVVGYAAFELTGQVTRSGSPAPQARQAAHAAPGTTAQGTTGTPTVRATSPAARATKGIPATKPAPARPRSAPLTPVRAESFGPDGTADGDNPQLAPNVLADQSAGWHTQWYSTAAFGQLKPGTGLLLDMGSTVTITRVTVQLGPSPGAELELRVARQPDPAAFRTSDTVAAASATATLAPAAPVQARYVLLWCTRLPPSGTRTYQLIVHRVTVEGRP